MTLCLVANWTGTYHSCAVFRGLLGVPLENIVRIAIRASRWIVGVKFRFTVTGFSGLVSILLVEGVERQISIKLVFIQV